MRQTKLDERVGANIAHAVAAQVLKTAIALAILRAETEAAQHALKYDLWTRQCELASKLRSTTKKAAADLETATSNLRKIKTTQLKLQVYAASKPTAKHATAAIALATAAELTTADLQETLKTMTSARMKAAALAHAGAAYISGFHTMLASNKNAGTAYCHSDSGNTGDGTDNVETKGCKHTDDADFVSGPSNWEGSIDDSGFKGHTEVTGATGQGTASKCGFFTQQGNPQTAGGFDVTSNGQKLRLAGGLLTLTTTDQPTAPSLTDLKTKQDDDKLAFWHKVHNAVHAVQKEQVSECPEPGEAMLKTIVAGTHIETALRITLSGLNSSRPSDIKGDLKNIKDAWFGPDNSKLKALWTAVDSEPVFDISSDKSDSKKL
uniref:Variant surface glycoprotein 1125.5114 n=1 Tax=Trypanosoma brucei TaxID=5691 RepID=A0A1J0RBI9_9TRYP|nr:variant surface glycoprotein 1125.5114 [Trypanosoma brucei]